MAATRLIALHANKGRTVAQSLGDRTDYAKNPEKTEKGELVTAYGCDPMTVDEEFLLQKRLYFQQTGKTQKSDVIAYQIRQSFKPGEITPEEANRLGHELAMRFTKGKFSFIVATHTDRAHIHNHIVFNSTAMDGSRKFKNFWFSGLALQHVSDLVCLENGLSVITPAPYSAREKRTTYPKRENLRSALCGDIDTALGKNPGNFEEFLRNMEQLGYEVKRGKNTAVKGRAQKRFIRLSSLDDGYREADIRAALSGEKQRDRRTAAYERPRRSVSLLIDIQSKMREKGAGYARWATVYNLKQMSKTLLFLRDHNIDSLDQLHALASERSAKRDELLGWRRSQHSRSTSSTIPKPAAPMKHTGRPDTVKSSLKPTVKRSLSIKQRSRHLMNWASGRSRELRNCRRNMRNSSPGRRRFMPNTERSRRKPRSC